MNPNLITAYRAAKGELSIIYYKTHSKLYVSFLATFFTQFPSIIIASIDCNKAIYPLFGVSRKRLLKFVTPFNVF